MNGTNSPASVSVTLTRRAEPIRPDNGCVVVDLDFNRMGRFKNLENNKRQGEEEEEERGEKNKGRAQPWIFTRI